MPTTFFLRDLKIGVLNSFHLTEQRGDGAATASANTTAGGTWIPIGTWSSKPLEPFIMENSISIRIRAAESNPAANASIECRLYRWSRQSGLSSILTLKQASELTTTDSAVNLSGVPSQTTFGSGDTLVIEVGITNAPGSTMGDARSVTISYNGPSENNVGDSFITISETANQKDRVVTTE